MHTLVERDERGRSAYRMGVIRPHYAEDDSLRSRSIGRRTAEDGFFFKLLILMCEEDGILSPVRPRLLNCWRQNSTKEPNGKKGLFGSRYRCAISFRLLVERCADFGATLQKSPQKIDPVALIGRYFS